MDSFLNRYKNLLVLVSVLIAQIVGLAVQIRRPDPNVQDGSSVRLIRSWAVALMSPPEKGLHGMGGGIRGLWSNYLDLRHVRRQNQDLRTAMGRLQLEQAALLEDARQGQRLQQLLGFQEHYIYSTVPAQVIGTAGTDQSRVLYIDKGSRDGLKPDMPVITPDGIVGKIKDVFRGTAQVLEISDQTSGAGVLLESTRLRGVLRGNALGQPQVINLLPDERVKPGERVITSGGDQIFPRGLPVGVVDHVAPDTQNPPYIDVIVKPAANLGHLEEVLVITKTNSQMPANQKVDLVESAAAAGTQRAADILAEKLPGLDQAQLPVTPLQADAAPVALKPPAPLHADRFTPNATPAAAGLTPGKAFSISNSVLLPARPRTSGHEAAPKTTKPAVSIHPGNPVDSGVPADSEVHKRAPRPAAPPSAAPVSTAHPTTAHPTTAHPSTAHSGEQTPAPSPASPAERPN